MDNTALILCEHLDAKLLNIQVKTQASATSIPQVIVIYVQKTNMDCFYIELGSIFSLKQKFLLSGIQAFTRSTTWVPQI